MNKVATNVPEQLNLSQVEKGDASGKNTPVGPLNTLKPEAPQKNEARENPHANILDSLLQALTPSKDATKPAEPVVDNPGPGVAKAAAAPKISVTAEETEIADQEKVDLEPAPEAAPKVSSEKAKEDAFAALRDWVSVAKLEGATEADIKAKIEAYLDEQMAVKDATQDYVIPSNLDLKKQEKVDAIDAIDGEAHRADPVEKGLNFGRQEKQNMGGLLNIAARISTLGATAGENPFAKKDDDKGEEKKDNKPAPFEKKDDSADKSEKKDDKKGDKKGEDKEEKKDDKKPAPFEKKEKSDEPKEEKSESKSDEKGDIKELKEALKIMEKFLSKEEKGGELGPELSIAKEVVEGIKELAGEDLKDKAEGLDLGAPAIEMEGPSEPIEKAGEEPSDMFGAPKVDMAKEMGDAMKPAPELPGGMKPIPTIKPNLAIAKFNVGDRVLSRAAEATDEDPGKVVAVCDNDNYVIDWGTEIPTEEHAKGLIKVDAGKGTDLLFGNAPKGEIAAIEPEGGQMAAFDNEETKVLSGMSFADAITRMSEDYDDDCEVMHIATGLKGKIVSKASDRMVIDFGGTQSEYWPNEVKLFSRDL